MERMSRGGFSVALCTYNGVRFLNEQLQSIATQTRLPDELVVCDDASTDATVECLQSFARTAPFPIQLQRNPQNLGCTANFEQAIRLCQGNLIALCDQDDIWQPDKLQRLEQAFVATPEAGLIFSDARVVDRQRQPLGYTLWQSVGLTPAEQQRFREGQAFLSLLRRFCVTGATLAFRANLRDQLLPIPVDWHHDAWIALVASALAPIVPLTDCLIDYRQHTEQLVGGRRRGLLQQYQTARSMNQTRFEAIAKRFTEALERLQSSTTITGAFLESLQRKIHHSQIRARMREAGSWRLPLIWQEVRSGHYSRYSRGWKAIAQDLFL